RRIMRFAYRIADASILPVPLESVQWLPVRAVKAFFIPIGANIPSPFDERSAESNVVGSNTIPTVAVFGVTTSPISAQKQEIEAIIYAARQASTVVGDLSL